MLMDYEINLPDYIALCINQDKPQLHCDGQCVLMQKIKEKEKQEAKKNMQVYEYSSLYTHNEPTVLNEYIPYSQNISLPYPLYVNSYSYSATNSLFRPPIA